MDLCIAESVWPRSTTWTYDRDRRHIYLPKPNIGFSLFGSSTLCFPFTFMMLFHGKLSLMMIAIIISWRSHAQTPSVGCLWLDRHMKMLHYHIHFLLFVLAHVTIFKLSDSRTCGEHFAILVTCALPKKFAHKFAKTSPSYIPIHGRNCITKWAELFFSFTDEAGGVLWCSDWSFPIDELQ